MNSHRAQGSDDDFAAVGEEPTIAARYAGTCATCGQRFGVGEQIAAVQVDQKPTYHHRACRYPATALLEEEGGASYADPTSKCSAKTATGKPCSNAPQKGERFCGPHLTQAEARAVQRRPSDQGDDASSRRAAGAHLSDDFV